MSVVEQIVHKLRYKKLLKSLKNKLGFTVYVMVKSGFMKQECFLLGLIALTCNLYRICVQKVVELVELSDSSCGEKLIPIVTPQRELKCTLWPRCSTLPVH